MSDFPDGSRDSPVWLRLIGAGTGCAMGGVGLLVLMAAGLSFPDVRSRVDAWSHDGSADPYTPELHARLRWAALLLGVLLIGFAVLWLQRNLRMRLLGGFRTTVQLDALRLWRESLASLKTEWPWLIVVAAVAVGMRLPWLTQPIRFDEATSWLHYASRPLLVTLATYDTPNNHVFHNLCLGVSLRLFGTSLASVRLTAFLAGIGTCLAAAWMTYTLCRSSAWPAVLDRLEDRRDRHLARFAGMLAGLCVGVSSPCIEFSTNARGYTLVSCLTMLCWWAGREAYRSGNRLAGGLCVLFAALGLWTIPVMIYSLVMLTLLVVWDPTLSTETRKKGGSQAAAGIGRAGQGVATPAPAVNLVPLVQQLAVGWGWVLGLTCVFYLPVLLVNGWGALTGNEYVRPMPLLEWLTGWPSAAVQGWQFVWRDLPLAARCMWVFGIIGVITLVEQPRGRLMLAAALVIPLVGLPLVQRVYPPSRVWLFLVPCLAVFVAWGWFERLRRLRSERLRRWLPSAVLGVMVVWPAWIVLRDNPISASWETGIAPQAEAAVEFLAGELQPQEPVITVCPASAPIVYYALQQGIDRSHFDPLDRSAPGASVVVVVSREGGFDQTLQDVVAAFALDEMLKGWKQVELWSQGGLSLIRLSR